MSTSASTTSRPQRQRYITTAVIALLLAALIAGAFVWFRSPRAPNVLSSLNPVVAKIPAAINGPYRTSRQTSPDRTVVTDMNGNWLATYTDKAHTVILAGPSRRFNEPQSTSATVIHSTWVRVLPTPFDGTVDQAWLKKELADTSPDILAIAMQYIYKAPDIKSNNLTIAGDASYGPLQAEKRKEGSDFNDYLGVAWKYGAVTDAAEPAQIHSMDCSGYMRMVWGYRSGLPLAGPNSPASAESIPRRAYQIQAEAPGIMLVPNTQKQVKDFSKLQIGDIVFFDANDNDGQLIDHNGMYIGRDNFGHYRFISSRKTADGPTLGDIGGASVLDGRGHYAAAYRSERRF